jgi:hypothetical protein
MNSVNPSLTVISTRQLGPEKAVNLIEEADQGSSIGKTLFQHAITTGSYHPLVKLPV